MITVTGGAGFIGSAIVDRLVAAGHDVRIVDCLHPAAHDGQPDYLNHAADYLWGDLRDPAIAEAAVRGADVVCHQASMVGLGIDFADAPAYEAHNSLATAELLRALHDRRFSGRIVLASSMVVYGEGRYVCDQHGDVRPAARSVDALDAGDYECRCPTCSEQLRPAPVTEDAALEPRNVYAATKLHQEHLVAAYVREHGGSQITLRYHNVYGPRMPRDTPYAGVASIFRSAVERGEAPRVYEDGGQLRDFVHVDDVATANVAAIEAPDEVSGPFNVASGQVSSVLDMAQALVDALGGTTLPEVVGGYRLGDVRHVFASPDKAAAELGFHAAVAFGAGMHRFATAPLRERAGATLP